MHNILYVDKSGNDSTGTGDISNPFLTIAHALAQVTAPATGNRWSVHIGSGLFSEATIAIPPWTWLVGYNGALASGNSQIAVVGGGNITITADWTGSCSGGMKDINVTTSTGILIDRKAIGTGGVALFDIYNCEIFGNVTFKAYSPYDEFNIINAIVDMNLTVSGGFNTIQDLIIFGSTTLDCAYSVNMFETDMLNCWLAGALAVNSSGSNTVTANMRGTIIDGAVTKSGSAVTLSSMLDYYNPTTPGDWASAPANIQQALDALAKASQASSAFSGSASLCALTSGGATGSLTIVNGIITAYTAPT